MVRNQETFMAAHRSISLGLGLLAIALAGVGGSALDAAGATRLRGAGASATDQTGLIRRSILDAITKNDPAVCTTLFTDHGIVDDANALYIRGFNGPLTHDPDQARSECEHAHSTDATPARSLVKIKKLKVAKSTAKASVEVGVGGTYQVRLLRDGRTWRIDGVS
jgi:hypothetical protein